MADRGKLTEAQRRLLRELANGAVIRREGGVNPRIYLNTTGKPVNWFSHAILQRAGLIESFKDAPHSLDPDYRITPAGRALLSEGEGND